MGATVAVNRKARHDVQHRGHARGGTRADRNRDQECSGRQDEPPGCLRPNRSGRGLAGGCHDRAVGRRQPVQPRAASRPEAAAAQGPDRPVARQDARKGPDVDPAAASTSAIAASPSSNWASGGASSCTIAAGTSRSGTPGATWSARWRMWDGAAPDCPRFRRGARRRPAAPRTRGARAADPQNRSPIPARRAA